MSEGHLESSPAKSVFLFFPSWKETSSSCQTAVKKLYIAGAVAEVGGSYRILNTLFSLLASSFHLKEKWLKQNSRGEQLPPQKENIRDVIERVEALKAQSFSQTGSGCCDVIRSAAGFARSQSARF